MSRLERGVNVGVEREEKRKRWYGMRRENVDLEREEKRKRCRGQISGEKTLVGTDYRGESEDLDRLQKEQWHKQSILIKGKGYIERHHEADKKIKKVTEETVLKGEIKKNIFFFTFFDRSLKRKATEETVLKGEIKKDIFFLTIFERWLFLHRGSFRGWDSFRQKEIVLDGREKNIKGRKD